jgi:hypothetical protein
MPTIDASKFPLDRQKTRSRARSAWVMVRLIAADYCIFRFGHASNKIPVILVMGAGRTWRQHMMTVNPLHGAGRVTSTILIMAAALSITAFTERATAKEVRSELRIRVGDKAPEFTLNASDGKRVKLSDYAGRIVLLDFYRAYW